MGPGGEGETPREGKAHEGHGFRFGPNNRPGERTLAGSKALKWGRATMGL
jgi:peptide methionine sulfoxide reductase MsrB